MVILMAFAAQCFHVLWIAKQVFTHGIEKSIPITNTVFMMAFDLDLAPLSLALFGPAPLACVPIGLYPGSSLSASEKQPPKC